MNKKLICGLSEEVALATIGAIWTLQDIIGYHFPWCPKFAHVANECTCGMDNLRIAKGKLISELAEATKDVHS